MKFKIQTSPYNPRKFTKENRKALKKSIEEFDDISGITINEKSGNIVSGNHRWEELEKKYGNLELQPVFQDRYAIMSGKTYTGFMARVVNWSMTKEKQANVMANSPNVMGEWSSDLQNVLQDIAMDTDTDLLDELRLSDMIIDMGVSDEDLDLTKDKKREKTQENEDDYELEDDETPAHSQVTEIISTIKITLPSEHKDEAVEEILKALSKLEWYDKVTIH